MAVAVTLGLVFDSNWLKGPVERMVTERLGRPFTIEGDLDLVPRWHPRLRMERVRLANPAWAVEPETLRLEAVEVSLALLPLFALRVVLPEVTLTKPVIALERNADGTANNWTFGRAEAEDPEERGEPPVIGRLTVDEGVLMFHDPSKKTALTLAVQTTTGPDNQPAMAFRASGTYAGRKLEAEGRGGSMLRLADTTAPYPLAGRFRIGATHGTVEGAITGLATFDAVDLALEVSGESLSELYGLLHVALPPTPPYRIAGRLVGRDEQWQFHDFEGRVGDSDLSGDVDVTYRDGRVRLEADLASKLLDLDDLGGFIGARPQTGPGETASARQTRDAAAKEASGRVLPDIPLKLDRLRAMDADVRFTGKSIRGKTPLDDLQTRLVLANGVLTLKPLNFGIAGGNVVSTLVLDGRHAQAGVDGDFEFRRIDLRKLFPDNATIAKSTGLVGGRAVLKGRGNSLAEVLAVADGSVGLAMSGGRVSNLVLELAGLDIAEALRLLFSGDKSVEMRCAIADVGVRQGLLEARHVLIDTTDTNINVRGTVNLANEELDMTLHPLPKDYSLLALRSPIHVRGTFKNPTIRPDSALLVRGGVAAILGAVAAPAAALIGLVESGPGDDADCERLIAAVEQHAGRDLPEVAPR